MKNLSELLSGTLSTKSRTAARVLRQLKVPQFDGGFVGIDGPLQTYSYYSRLSQQVMLKFVECFGQNLQQPGLCHIMSLLQHYQDH